jgi:DNA invertase Pin-like site-specific DNA recombinase
MRLALYARVSTTDQHLDPQLDELRAYAARRGCDVSEFSDVLSGKRSARPGLDALLGAARRRQVDGVVVVRLDRLARSLADLARLGDELSSLGVELVSLREAIDTATPMGRALFGMCAVFAQLERDIIADRTRAGLAAARRRGRHPGRPRALDADQVARARRMRSSGQSLSHIARVLGCGATTVARSLKG